MRRIFTFLFCFSLATTLFGQFNSERLRIHVGYQLHNTGANRFNTLINHYNNTRYPLHIDQNLPNINFLHGMALGANYEFFEGFEAYAVLKNKHQHLKTYSFDARAFRSYRVRENNLEIGINYGLFGSEGKRFQQFAGGGLVFGVLSIYTGTHSQPQYPGNGKMLNIDHTASLGLAIQYEARLLLTDYLAVYARPNFQLTIPAYVRNLNDFLNPVYEDGVVSYQAALEDKYNKGSLNGVAIEAGLVVYLPALNFGG